jgi:tetratricopeptide (TPR) repeat protein
MTILERPLESLHDELKFFVRAKHVKLLRISTSADLHGAVVDLCAVQELHADNRAPWLPIPDAFVRADAGWTARLNRVRRTHLDRLDQIRRAGGSVTKLGPTPTVPGVAGFAEQLVQIQQARATWHDGVVPILAPTRVDDPTGWTAALTELVSHPDLSAARWVVVDTDSSATDQLVASLGRHARSFSCFLDEAAACRELDDRLAGMQACSASAPSYAKVGAAWPRGVEPPPRPGQSNFCPKTALAAGAPAAAVYGFPVAKLVMGAAAALRRGDTDTALQAQQEACDLAVRSGMAHESLTLRLILGSYLTYAGQSDAAIGEFEAAADAAITAERPDLAIQALMGAGAVHASAQRPELAAAAYDRAAELSSQLRGDAQRMLTIEALRLAGQHHLAAGDIGSATQQWLSAVQLGDMTISPNARGSAPEAGLALAELCRQRKLLRQADSLTETVRRWQGGDDEKDTTELVPPAFVPMPR